MKKIPLLFTFSLVLALAGRVSAEPLLRDLGKGLTYCRVHTLPTDLPVAGKPGAVVLDLRFVHITEGATTAIGTWLKTRSAAAPAFVLLNGDTAPDVLAYFASHDATAGVVTLGSAAPGFVPDIALRISTASERSAYDALEHGTSVEALLTDPLDKPRHDEAAIAQERTAPVENDGSSDTDLEPADAAHATVATPPRLIDYVLLRAVHLHRALLALRKL